MLPDEGRFPLLVHDRRFVALYQRGDLNPFRSRWTRSDSGSEYLVVCPCGRGTHARYLDDAVAALRSSYILHDDGSHEHDESAFPCNIIEATQDGEHGFIVGKIVAPELVDYFNSYPESEKKISLPTKEVVMESLIRWQPFRELTSIQDRMNRLFDEFFRGRAPFAGESEESWGFAPPVDIYEDAHKLTFKVEIPGMEEKDLKVEIEDNTLTVSGERRVEKEVKEEHFRRKERRYGAFSRSFTLPASVDTEKIEANYANGVLTIELPKRAELKPKQVKVNVAKTLKAA